MHVDSVGTPALWIGFTAFVLGMLALDLGVFHKKAHEVRVREALTWTGIWISLALVFNVGVYFWFGSERALEFLTGYVIEKALSVDNIFVFIVVFSVFAVPAKLQHRVLFWGILGALVMRAIFIVLGAALLQRFHWVIYVFGAFLVFTGVKLLVQRDDEVHPEKNPLFRLFQRFVPSVSDYREGRFTVVQAGKRYATPLLLVLVAIEATDIVFAVDSIPAIFAITTDPFIVYTSNIFAILGLRALYFALAGMMDKFHYLKVGLSLVLVFVGAKMLVAGFYKVPIALSLGVIVALLGGSMLASLLRKPARESAPESPEPAAESPVEAAPESVAVPASRARTSIVCGLDFSEGASAAAGAAAAIAKRLDLRLELVHVASSAGGDAESRLGERAEELQARYGVPVVPRVEIGSAAEKLVAVARRLDARLLAVSSLGAAKEHRWLLGSVAEQVARSSSIPVLVVREAAQIEAWARGERPLRVLVGVDLTKVSRAALKWAGKLAEIGPCELIVAQIARPTAERLRAGGGVSLSREAQIEEQVRELTESLQDWAQRALKSRASSCIVQPGWGRVDSHLIQLASESEVDLVVVGTHQRMGLARLREGSISSGVLAEAPMNVATVPSA